MLLHSPEASLMAFYDPPLPPGSAFLTINKFHPSIRTKQYSLRIPPKCNM